MLATLQTLAAEIDRALKNGRPKELKGLLQTHGRLVRQLLSPAKAPQAPRAELLKTVEKYKQWIERTQCLLVTARAKIDNAQSFKNTRRQIANAYARKPSRAGNFISRKG